MARAHAVWVVEQYGSLTAVYEVIATFTVKHELKTFLEYMTPGELRRCRVNRFADGFHRVYDTEKKEFFPWEPEKLPINIKDILA